MRGTITTRTVASDVRPIRARAREGTGRVSDGLAPVEFTRRRDVELGSPLGELLIRDRPGLVGSFSQTLIEALPLLGRRELEVTEHHRGTDVCRYLP